MKFAVVDVETSPLKEEVDATTDECCEFAIVIADYDTKSIITQYSQLFNVGHWNDNAAKIHKIPQGLCQKEEHASILPKLESVIDLSSIDYVVAHNAIYDKTVLKRYWPKLAELKWLCSMYDISYNMKITSRKLSHIAVDHGIIMRDYHRAMNDCLALTGIIFQNDLNKAWETKNMPKFTIKATGKWRDDVPEQFKSNNWKWVKEEKSWFKKHLPYEDIKEQYKFVKTIGFAAIVIEEPLKDY